VNEIYWEKNKKYKEENITDMNDVRKNNWICVTYVRIGSKFITKLFRNTNIGISYKTNNIVCITVGL
jgi:hypothetical protein